MVEGAKDICIGEHRIGGVRACRQAKLKLLDKDMVHLGPWAIIDSGRCNIFEKSVSHQTEV
jgi:hypothetical protein